MKHKRCQQRIEQRVDVQRHTRWFSYDNTFVRIGESVRQNDVFVVQSFAGRISAVIPYHGYGRTDKKDRPRVPITARLVAKLVMQAGADRVLSVDLHTGRIQGCFDIPVDETGVMFLTAQYFQEKRLGNAVVVSPDLGNTKRARNFADMLECPLAIIERRRRGNGGGTEVLNLIGSVEGSQVVIVDDEIDTAGSITQATQVCLDRGAADVYATCIRPVFSGHAVERLDRSEIREVVVTNTIALSREKRFDRLTLLSVAPLLGEAIQRIHAGSSVSTAYRAIGAFLGRLSILAPEG